MRFLTRIRRTLTTAFRRNLDLLAVFALFIALAPTVPVGHILAREDLAPWMMLSLAVATFVRARPIGDGPHPQLTVQLNRIGGWFHRAAFTATPLIAWAWHDAGYNLAQSMLPSESVRIDPIYAGIGAAGLVAVPVFLAMGRRHEATSWDPPGRSSVLKWLFWAVPLTLFSLASGYLVGQNLIPALGKVGPALLCGTAFLATATAGQKAQYLRQRRASGNRDGSRYKPNRFSEGLAFVGPSAGMLLLQSSFLFLSSPGDYLSVTTAWLGTLDFDQAYVGVAHVLAWASIVWGARTPVAKACALWEVVPTGGKDKTPEARALGFEEAPEGALRFNPLRSKRIFVLHPWLVPVKAARIGDLDDPVAPLWGRRPPLPGQHLLGDCVFDPDPFTLDTQGDSITVRLRGQDAFGGLAGGSETRRLVILRSYVSGGIRNKSRMKTYRWDQKVPEGTVQIIDATTDVVTLMDGDVIVSSMEGVARAYEVEIGADIYDRAEAEAFRPPQLEDYVQS
jgi:hypothetical protein